MHIASSTSTYLISRLSLLVLGDPPLGFACYQDALIRKVKEGMGIDIISFVILVKKLIIQY